MTKREKLIEKFLAKPKSFTWDELTKLLKHLEYKQCSAGKTGGSRVRFIRENYPPITLHKPRPRPVLKRYQIDEIISHLKQEHLL